MFISALKTLIALDILLKEENVYTVVLISSKTASFKIGFHKEFDDTYLRNCLFINNYTYKYNDETHITWYCLNKKKKKVKLLSLFFQEF